MHIKNIYSDGELLENATCKELYTQVSLFNEPGSPEDEAAIGFENARLVLTPGQLLQNIRNMQARNNIKQSETLVNHLGACSLDVEAEYYGQAVNAACLP